MKKQGERKLGDLIKSVTNRRKFRDKLGEVKIRQLWEEEMGAFIAGNTDSIRLQGDQLKISVRSAALKQELFMGREKIRDRVNERLGEEVVRKVILY